MHNFLAAASADFHQDNGSREQNVCKRSARLISFTIFTDTDKLSIGAIVNGSTCINPRVNRDRGSFRWDFLFIRVIIGRLFGFCTNHPFFALYYFATKSPSLPSASRHISLPSIVYYSAERFLAQKQNVKISYNAFYYVARCRRKEKSHLKLTYCVNAGNWSILAVDKTKNFSDTASRFVQCVR